MPSNAMAYTRERVMKNLLTLLVIAALGTGPMACNVPTDPGAGSTAGVTGTAAPAARAPAGRLATTLALDDKTVPHYFGPYPNWALSPLPQGTCSVTTTTVCTSDSEC